MAAQAFKCNTWIGTGAISEKAELSQWLLKAKCIYLFNRSIYKLQSVLLCLEMQSWKTEVVQS